MRSPVLVPIVLRSPVALGAVPPRVGDDLVRWAAERPARLFMAERDADRSWRGLSYADALERVRSIGAGLLARNASPKRPVAVVAENGIAHALVAYAAMYAGIPVSQLSVAYARPDADRARLAGLLELLEPAVVFAGDARIAERVRTTRPGIAVVTSPDELIGDPAAADLAFASVGPETVAKLLFTSGSTGAPKAVVTTNRMMAANQTMQAQAWPDTTDEPVLVDWLPWSHVFGGSFNVGFVLRNGGTLYVDAGKPAPGAFATTIENLRAIAPTSYYNVPLGYALLLEALEADAALATFYFSRLRLVCNAGAALAPALRERLQILIARYATRNVHIITPWGTTETAPMATGNWGNPLPKPDTIGLPVPGVEIKLAPVDDRYEIRVRGANVTPGYWRNPEATAAAFDEDGFYCTGDAGELRNPADPAEGILFAGRIAENFKLASGTWVNVGALRLALLDAGAPLIEDVVIGGHDRESLVTMVFLRLDAARSLAGLPGADHAALAGHAAVREHVRRSLAAHNARNGATSMRIARAVVLPEGPRRDDGEITDKGTINQRRALTLRAATLATLTGKSISEDVIVPA